MPEDKEKTDLERKPERETYREAERQTRDEPVKEEDTDTGEPNGGDTTYKHKDDD